MIQSKSTLSPQKPNPTQTSSTSPSCRSPPPPPVPSSVVAFRKSNKIGFFIRVIPQKEDAADVVVSLKIRHDFRNLAAPVRSSEEGAEPAAEPTWLTHHVELRLGPLAP